MRLRGRIALVTGGARGIGRATVLLLAREGATVAINDLDAAGASEVCQQVQQADGRALVVEGNVARRADVDAMVAAILAHAGRLDILINNAGVTHDALTVHKKEGRLTMMSEEQWDSVIDTNLKGTFLCAQAAAVPMIEQGYGRIVNTASVSALGHIAQANYSASKAGVIGLTKTLALELARHGVTVNCVAPGGTNTSMMHAVPERLREALVQRIPLKRLAEPNDIANVHLFLASDEAAYITGHVIFCDGGATIGTQGAWT